MTEPGRGYKSWLLILLVATYACAFVDRIIVAVVGPALRRELALTDLEFGLLGGMAFALFYSAFGLPVARLAERRNRVGIISVSVALWSVMTVLSGAVTNYWQLLLCRMGVGVGEAGGNAPAHSLISDYYSPARRASALAVYSAGVPLGVMIGAGFGGFAAEHFGWRAAFLLAGAPGLLLALLVWLTIREPDRGASDVVKAPGTAPPFRHVWRRLSTTATFVHLVAACSLTTVAGNGTTTFAPSYFVRQFGMGMGEVGLMYGLILGVAGMTGILTGGFVVQAGARRDARWYVWVPAVGAIVAAPLYLLAYAQESSSAALTFSLVAALSLSLYVAPSFALVQNLAPARMRASAAALTLLAMNVLGQGVGPVLMGWVSDLAAAREFTGGSYGLICFSHPAGAVARACEDASAAGVQFALTSVLVFLLWGALHFVLAGRSIARDLEVHGS